MNTEDSLWRKEPVTHVAKQKTWGVEKPAKGGTLSADHVSDKRAFFRLRRKGARLTKRRLNSRVSGLPG